MPDMTSRVLTRRALESRTRARDSSTSAADRLRTAAVAACVVASLAFGCATAAPPAAAAAGTAAHADLDRRVDAILASYPSNVEVGLWLERLPHGPVYRRGATRVLPSASAIKSAYMVELFAAYPRLDEPVPGADAVLDTPGHPALAPFDEATRAEIREQLRGATVRRLARTMIRGDGVSNAVYNAAANVVTAVLGGPEALTRRIHRRAADWRDLVARRYMLADRHVTGDNEATAAGLAAVLRAIATGSVPDLDPSLVAPMREILAVPEVPAPGEPGEGAHYFKSGSLDSDPPVRILSGWWARADRSLLYVVIASRPESGSASPEQAGVQLAALVERLRSTLLGAW